MQLTYVYRRSGVVSVICLVPDGSPTEHSATLTMVISDKSCPCVSRMEVRLKGQAPPQKGAETLVQPWSRVGASVKGQSRRKMKLQVSAQASDGAATPAKRGLSSRVSFRVLHFRETSR